MFVCLPPQPSAALWMNVVSVGDAGASCLGYFGGCFSPDAMHIMAHGFTGRAMAAERLGLDCVYGLAVALTSSSLSTSGNTF